MKDPTKVTQQTAEYVTALIRSFKFEPQFSAAVLTQDRIFNHTTGYFIPSPEAYNKLINRLHSQYSTVAVQTIKKQCDEIIHLLLDKIVDTYNSEWDHAFTLVESTSDLIDQELLLSAIEGLLSNLVGLVRDYIVFVPLMGIELSISKYELGPITLARTLDSLPVIQKIDGSAEFQHVHPKIYEHFASASCVVQIQLRGDTEFARQEGVRQAGQLAAILNLHLAIWNTLEDTHQKIRCVGIPSSYTRVVLVQTDLLDESGISKPTYLPGVSNHGFMKQKLDQTQLNKVKQEGFNKIWRCFEQRNKPKSLEERIRRSVMWFDKAVNFDESDAQFVGLATALEILLTSEANINNPFSTWSGIAQQLADRCAFLMGHDLESRLEVVRRVKDLYGTRSGIVHGGKAPTTTELIEMVQLVSLVILNFIQCDFTSFEHFEGWIRQLQYSINLNEIGRLYKK